MTRDEVLRLRALIEKAAESLDDKSASDGAMLFPRLKGDGSLVKTGMRINWGGIIKRASVDLWDTPENDPDHAPDLWETVLYKDGYRVLTGPISAANPVQADEICWYEDVLYRNTLGVASTYLPIEYPAGWEAVA